jgi:hypothetical protein
MENTTPNGWTSVDTSSDSIAANATITEKRLEIALDAVEMLMDQIRDCDEKSLGSLKMAAYMMRMEWLEPTKKSLYL